MSGHGTTLAWGRRCISAMFATATVVVALLQSRRIFTAEYRVWPVVGAAVAVAAVALAVSSAHVILRVLCIVTASVGGAAAAVVSASGALPDDLVRAPLRGISDLVGTVWPSPPLAAGVGALAIAGCLCAGIAVDLVVRRTPGTALIPSLALIGLVAMLSAPAGPPSMWSVAAYVAAALGVLGSRTFAFRSSVASISAAVVIVAALCVPIVAGDRLLGDTATTDRYDPRLNVAPPADPRLGISPLARLDEWLSRTPAQAMFITTLVKPAPWRLVGLTRYDGRTWLPADDYRRAGSVLAPHDDLLPSSTVAVSIGDLDAVWLPSLDRTLSVSADVRVDGGRSGLLADVTPTSGTTYELSVQAGTVNPAQLANARATAATSPFIDGFDLSPELRGLATSITAGARTDFERAEAIATYLRDEFVLDVDSPPGHSIAVLDLFINQSRRGRDEQFVASYGLLAAAVGLPVRIAVGFDTVTSPDGTGTVALSDHATAWPEVNFDDFGWVPFDPVPVAVNVGAPALGDGAVAPTDDPTVTRPPTTAVATVQTTVPDRAPDGEAVAAPAASISNAAVGAAVGLAVLIVGIGGYIAFILWVKSRRRRRRRDAPDPRDRAVGAFASGIDVLIDLGASAPPAFTNAELVASGTHTVGESAAILAPVAALATEAVYAPEAVSVDAADQAWTSTERFEANTVDTVGRFRRLRAKASLRSLRRGWD
jgi:transglutaminase-like putative cysteine protease